VNQRDDFQELASLVLGADERGLILVLGAYFDDAGTHDDASVVCWAGFIGTSKQWAKLDRAWKAKLAHPISNTLTPKPPLKRFHLAECRACDGEYRGYSDTNASSLRYDFREIISESGVVGVAYGIDAKAYRHLVRGDDERHLGDAEQVCFAACFKGAYQQARKYYPEEDRLALFFDKVAQPERRAKLEKIAGRIEEEEFAKPKIISATWADMTETRPLQAADTIATENTWFAQRFLADENAQPDPHMKHFLSNIDCLGHIMRERDIRHYMWKHLRLDGPNPLHETND